MKDEDRKMRDALALELGSCARDVSRSSGREAMAHPLAAEADLAGKVPLRFREQAVQRSSNPADFPVDFERTQAGGHKAGQAARASRGKRVARSRR